MNITGKDELAPKPESTGARSTGNTAESEASMALAAPQAQNSEPVLRQPSFNWIDLPTFRIGRDFRRWTGRRLLPSVPIFRLNYGESFIVRPGVDWTVRTWGVESEDGEFYPIVQPLLWSQLRPVLQNVDLFTVMSQKGTVALWPVNRSKTARSNRGISNLMKVATSATGEWVSVIPNITEDECHIFDDDPYLSAPLWPHATFEELLNAAFRDRIICDLEHPVLQRLGRQTQAIAQVGLRDSVTSEPYPQIPYLEIAGDGSRIE